MLQCPKCGASYDDEVEYCFVDGEALEPVMADTGPPSISPPQLASVDSAPRGIPGPGEERTFTEEQPMEAPSPPNVRTATPSMAPPAHPAPPPIPAPAPEATPSSGGSSMLLVGIAMAAALVTCTGLGGGLMVGGFFSGDDLAATAAVEAPAPAPAPAVAPPPVAPEPVPEPAVPVVRSVDITSAPDGAEVWEGGQLLCVTPCKVEHGAGQDLPRQFILKRGGHEDLTVELQTLGVPLRGELVKKKTAPRPPSPAPAVRPTPKPKPQPAPPADDDLRVER